MLYLRQLSQAAIEGADVVGGDICFVYTQADADHAACIRVGCIIIEDMLQFIVDLRPGIVIGIAISLVHLDRGGWGQTCDHLYVQCRFTLRTRRATIDVDEREMTLEVNTVQVVLNIIRVRAVSLHKVNGHILPVQAMLIEGIVVVGSGYVTWNKRLAIRATIERSIPRYLQCRSEEHTSELQSLAYLVCRLLLEKKKNDTFT